MRIASVLRAAGLVLTTGLLATAAVPVHAQGMVGTFQACYRTKAMPGGVNVALNLIVVAPSKTMSGNVVVTQAINPPLDARLMVSGSYKNGPRRHIATREPDDAGLPHQDVADLHVELEVRARHLFAVARHAEGREDGQGRAGAGALSAVRRRSTRPLER